MRPLLLAALLDGAAHGYELMRRLEEHSGGRWRPSPGSVYPLLQLLQDEGLVRSRDEGERKVYELTDTGREQADRKWLEELASGTSSDAGGHDELRGAVRQLRVAAQQMSAAGTPEQIQRAATIVHDARKGIYQLLADAE